MTVVMPAMTRAQRNSWHALMDLYDRKPTGWTLVGGQMVHLHCAERGASPSRPTDDVDAVLDVRAEPRVLLEVTQQLRALGFGPSGTSPEGHQHRWHNDDAVVDLLIPRHLGQRASGRKGAGGGTTLETPGAQQALDRTQNVQIDVAGRVGTVRRPDLLGALVAKASAYGVPLDRARTRHLHDFTVLATLTRPSDDLWRATRLDRERLENALGALVHEPRIVASVEDGAQGLAQLRRGLAQRAPQGPAGDGAHPQDRVTRGTSDGGQFASRRRPETGLRLPPQ